VNVFSRMYGPFSRTCNNPTLLSSFEITNGLLYLWLANWDHTFLEAVASFNKRTVHVLLHCLINAHTHTNRILHAASSAKSGVVILFGQQVTNQNCIFFSETHVKDLGTSSLRLAYFPYNSSFGELSRCMLVYFVGYKLIQSERV